jgi:ornithine carbamoyltransferase
VSGDLRGRSLCAITDLTKEEFLRLVDLAAELRTAKRVGAEVHHLEGRNIALLFEKASTRTRAAFEVGAHDQGAHVTYLGPGDTHFGDTETVADTARVLGRMFDGIEFRGFAQATVEGLAAHAGVPVWNGLTDLWHPTQMLADVRTMLDHADRPVEELSCCYVGDGRNNTANSLLITGALLGMDIRVAAPDELQPSDSVFRTATDLAAASGARVTVSEDPATTVAGVDFVYTDVWLSMGEPDSAWDERIRLLRPFQVDKTLLDATGNPDVRFLHCLPACHTSDTATGHRILERFGLAAMEVSDDVFESPASVVFDQAENRMHTIKALMVATMAA